jgi:hypothetical protein
MYQLRINLKPDDSTTPGKVLWTIVNIKPGGPFGDTVTTVISGGGDDLSNVAQEGAASLIRLLIKPEGPARHEFDCACGCLLTIEARRSRKNLYSWDSPREVMCSCGRVFDVKLNFAEGSGIPRLSAIYRTMVVVAGGPPPAPSSPGHLEDGLDAAIAAEHGGS